MSDVKQSFTVALFNFRQWKKNPRIIMAFVLAFVLCLLLTDTRRSCECIVGLGQ